MKVNYQVGSDLRFGKGEPYRYFCRFSGTVQHRKETIARVDGLVFLFESMLNERQSWFETCDVEQQSMDICEAMCRRNNYQDFVEAAGGPGYDLLHVEGMQILPAYRGQGLGHAILLNTIQTFGRGCAVVVIEPHPIRYTDQDDVRARPKTDFDTAMMWNELANTEQRYKAGARKLAAHWAKLGFERVPKSKRFWYLELNNFVVPSEFQDGVYVDGDDEDEDDDDE